MGSTNKLLNRAMKRQDDEFYTTMDTVRKELCNYEDSFRGLIVYCNCDDFSRSAFFQYFRANFRRLGLRRLVATCYGGGYGDLFSVVRDGRGVKAVYDGERIEVSTLHGDGSFDSPECRKILSGCDVVVTNPPFSLIRKFMRMLVRSGKRYLFLCSYMAWSYMEFRPLFMKGLHWPGHNFGCFSFIGPNGEDKAVNCCWLTNLAPVTNRPFVELTEKYDPEKYHLCVDTPGDPINVDAIADIPCDYYKPMAVPITIPFYTLPFPVKYLGFCSERLYLDNGDKPFKRCIIQRVE